MVFCLTAFNASFSIPVLAETLHLNADEAEKWIANVIRNARLDAKIDAAKVRLTSVSLP